MAKELRHEWEFRYDSEVLLRCAESRLEHHQERLAYWQQEYAKREKDLRAKGLDVRKMIRQGSASSTAYHNQATLDADKLQACQEADTRITLHQQQIEDYTRWINVLEDELGMAVVGATRPSHLLTVHDAAFFGI